MIRILGHCFLVFIRLCFLDIVHREKSTFLPGSSTEIDALVFCFSRDHVPNTRRVFFGPPTENLGAILFRTVIEQTRFFGTDCGCVLLSCATCCCMFFFVALLYFLLFFASSSCAFYRCNFFD